MADQSVNQNQRENESQEAAPEISALQCQEALRAAFAATDDVKALGFNIFQALDPEGQQIVLKCMRKQAAKKGVAS